MCLQVFVASDEPLPLISYGPDSPVFQTELLDEQSLPVVQYFSKPYVYYLSSVGGCPCGFGYGLYELEILDDPDIPAEIKANVQEGYNASRSSVQAMKAYLRMAIQTGEAEVYACWIGDEEITPETRCEVTLDHFGGEEFQLVERQILTVTRAADE
ncbi:hypothetical protein CCAX7_46880 [Capsulimonas corticalis]|uniref:Uncharacterized protein n=1 Tax=Capsulimonas corticalis TaxID=2219043 RepID=A0A402CQB4_9BACT|nr:hypothetical protein [Capsulimonas corticalis]BDI32637.1 hypothetical protein CCAX7_46880 [Capsulimonas corticalis]